MSRVFMKGTRHPSSGRRDLARAMGIPQIRRTDSQYVPRPGDVLVNWGQTHERYTNDVTWINHPSAVQRATDKQATFYILEQAGVPTVPTMASRIHALDWLHTDGRVMHRSLNSASQGRGITILTTTDEVHSREGGYFCRIFGDEDNREFRIHVVAGVIIDRAQKRKRSRRNGYEGRIDRIIRSGNRGWVYCREGIESPQSLDAAAINAVSALDLDFGAVDCAVTETGSVCVYEVNTAPGIEGTTLSNYSAALINLLRRTG